MHFSWSQLWVVLKDKPLAAKGNDLQFYEFKPFYKWLTSLVVEASEIIIMGNITVPWKHVINTDNFNESVKLGLKN